MTNVNIRIATQKDFDSIAVINPSVEISKTWQMDQGFENGTMTTMFREITLPRPIRLAYPFSEKSIRKNLEENGLNLVAEDKKHLFGFISLIQSDGIPAARVTDLIVDENYRRRGIGTSLLISAVDWLITRNVNGITLEMMLKNYPGINMSKKLGFEFCGFNEIYFQNGQTAIFFHRKII